MQAFQSPLLVNHRSEPIALSAMMGEVMAAPLSVRSWYKKLIDLATVFHQEVTRTLNKIFL